MIRMEQAFWTRLEVFGSMASGSWAWDKPSFFLRCTGRKEGGHRCVADNLPYPTHFMVEFMMWESLAGCVLARGVLLGIRMVTSLVLTLTFSI